jgi:hypothetical protein
MIKNYLNCISSVALVAAPLCLCFATSASAQTTVFSDDFSDNNRDGWYIYNGDPVTSLLDTSNGYLETVSSGDYNYWGGLANFSGVTLADGDFINLSLDFQILEDVGSNTIALGLFDSAGTTITADQTDLTNLTDESGYYMFNRSADLIMKAGNATGLGQVNGTDSMVKTQPSHLALADSTWHTYSLTIVNSGGQITATTVYDLGLGSELTQNDSGSAVDILTFDTVAIQSRIADYAVDNILITTDGTVIPEPSSFALLAGMFGLTLIMLRRRK